MLGDDLGCPLSDGASESADLEGHLRVGEVKGDLGNPCRGELGIGVIGDMTRQLLRPLREPHFAVRVARGQHAHQAYLAVDG